MLAGQEGGRPGSIIKFKSWLLTVKNKNMQKTYIGILLVITLVVFFAIRNPQPVYVDFGLWKVHSNLSLVMVVTVTFGALSSFLFSLPYLARKKQEIKA